MNLFNTKMTAVDADKVTTCEKKHVRWSKGLKGTGLVPASTTMYEYHTPAGVFNTAGEAMAANNVTRDQLVGRCKRDTWPDWNRKLVRNADMVERISKGVMNNPSLIARNKDPAYKEAQRQRIKNSEAAIKARNASRSLAEETKRLRGNFGGRSYMIQTPNGVFNGIQELIKASGHSRRTIYFWMKKYPEHYYYIKDAK